jgi:DNA-binding IclR family transcriptional regulator
MGAELTPLDAAVLRWFDAHGIAPAAEVAAALDLPVAVVEAICAELEREGLIEPAPLN